MVDAGGCRYICGVLLACILHSTSSLSCSCMCAQCLEMGDSPEEDDQVGFHWDRDSALEVGTWFVHRLKWAKLIWLI